MTSGGRQRERGVMRAIVFLAMLVAGGAGVLTEAQAMRGNAADGAAAGGQEGGQEGRKLAAQMAYREARLYEVGGVGVPWAAPSSAIFFQNWAAALTFRPGDALQFNKPAQGYIDRVPAASYSNCSFEGYYEYWSTSNMNEFVLQLEARHASGDGKLYFIHEGPSTNNCTKGMKFIANVADVKVPNPPVQPPNTAKLQGRTAKEFQVGGTGKVWTIPSTTNFYTNWANNITFRIGDTLRFDIKTTDFEVSQVPYASFEMCVYTGWKWYTKYGGSETFTFATTGVYYFVASQPQYCLKGMRFATYVYNSNGTLDNPPSSNDGGGLKWYYWVLIVLGIFFVLGCCCGGGAVASRSGTSESTPGAPSVELSSSRFDHPVFADADGSALYGSDGGD